MHTNRQRLLFISQLWKVIQYIRFDFVEVLDHIVANLNLLLRLHKFERSFLVLDHQFSVFAIFRIKSLRKKDISRMNEKDIKYLINFFEID